MKKVLCVAFGAVLLLGTGCTMSVLRQDIPVSTNPMGAQIYVNGQPAGTTPRTVSLERTRDHIVTLVKDDYRQEDVVIRRQYQQDRVLMKAVQTGLDTGLFFKDPRMGLQSGFGSVSSQEQTGEAYLLVPPVVQVTLRPLGGRSHGVEPQGGSMGERASSHVPDAEYRSYDVGPGGAVKGAVAGGIAAGSVKPVEKKWQTPTSTTTHVSPDGTTVTRTTKGSVSVSASPSGVVDVMDKMFR